MKPLLQIALLFSVLCVFSSQIFGDEERPNLVIILVDDMGYADLGCTGAEGYQTPTLDRLADEGTRFTNFYVAQSVCSASRAALLTGCYPNRVGIGGALNVNSRIGIHNDELLLSEMLKQQGYATSLVGKWHLGHDPQFNPTRHGFDEWFGLPYSNDMWPGHPTVPQAFPPLPLIEGEQVIETNPDQSLLTTRYTDHAVRFISENHQRPFFLYLAHTMPHVPLFASEEFLGSSEQGLYGDVMQEIDASTATILAALEQANVADNTLVIFFSDNGPWLSYGNHAGLPDPFRSGKLTTWEGGLRVPCLMRWPRQIPAGRICDELITAMDLLPTIAHLTGAKLPERPIDGLNLWPVIHGEERAVNPRETFFYYQTNELQAVRQGKWKLHAPHAYVQVDGEPGHDGKPANWTGTISVDNVKSDPISVAKRHGYRIEETGWALYNLDTDPGETKNILDQHPRIVRRLKKLLEQSRADLGDSLTDRQGSGTREPGQVR